MRRYLRGALFAWQTGGQARSKKPAQWRAGGLASAQQKARAMAGLMLGYGCALRLAP
jgi:hypothetical protein